MCRSTASPARPAAAPSPRAHPRRGERVLHRYNDDRARPREVIVRSGSGGVRLVIDRGVCGVQEQRLLAKLDAEEPAENAALVCALFLEAPIEGRRCRAPLPADEHPARPAEVAPNRGFEWSVTARGFVHALLAVPGGMSIPELRWTRAGTEDMSAVSTVSLRAAIAMLESYEPLCRQTREALAHHDEDAGVSRSVLRTELARVLRSPIVLNRGLREAVLERVRREETTMSEIAIRCGRLKRDARGNRCGETSWLARRIGLLPEGGRRVPTPWVHSDVLALIARDGLGIAPREVELG